MIIDSDPRPAQFLKSRLEKFGIEVLTADAAHGFRVARNDMPSMILAAHLLPDGNAEHLLWKLRSRPRTRQLLVFITAETLSKYSQDNLKREVVGAAGAAGFFTKPLDTEVSTRPSSDISVSRLRRPIATSTTRCGPRRKNYRRDLRKCANALSVVSET